MPASNPAQNSLPEDNDPEDLLHPDDAAEEINQDDDDPMEDDDDADDADDANDDVQEEISLQNDSAAHFDHHSDSIFCIAQHPLITSLIVTGGGDDVAYLFDSSLIDNEPGPVLPTSYESDPQPKSERKGIPPLQKLEGHTDSVNAVAFTLPSGEFVVTAGLDGKLRAWSSSSATASSSSIPTYTFVAESAEVEEINWVSPNPSPAHPNTIALGASDGSVWIYTLNASDRSSPLSITQAYYLHTETCTAGSWTRDGRLLATVSEDSSLFVYDPWSEVAAAGLATAGPGQAIISLTASDQRFAVEGGLYSISISPGGTIAAAGGAEGNIRIVSLPRLNPIPPPSSSSSSSPTPSSTKPTSAKTNPRKPGNPPSSTTPASSSSTAQMGTLLASLQSGTGSIESLSFSAPPLTLLAAAGVDGSIALFDVAHRFALRRAIAEAHEGHAVVKVEFVVAPRQDRAYYLTSCGLDGVVRRWDCRGSSLPGKEGGAGVGQGAVREWRGHRGDGEGGGVLGFVQGEGSGGERIVTAGDDGVALVFPAEFT